MAQTVNKYQIIQKVSETDTVLLHPETEAGIVGYDGTTSGLTAKTVQAAVDEVTGKVKQITDGMVTGVKGSAESAYRTGQVNLTAANVGAETAGAVSTHNASASAHSDIRTAVGNAQSKADSAYALAEGRSKAVSFDTAAAMTTALKAAAKTEFKVGDNLFIKATDTPDYWVSKVLDTNTGTYGYFEISPLETEKIDLSGYQQKTDSALQTSAKTVTAAINEVKGTADSAKSKADANAVEITKINNGTTKVGMAGSADNAITAVSAGKWTTARTLGVSVNSGTKKDGTTAISGSGSQAVDGSADKTVAVTLGDSGVAAGAYSSVQVNAKGIVVAGGKILEVGTSGQTTPSAALAVGGLFFKVI